MYNKKKIIPAIIAKTQEELHNLLSKVAPLVDIIQLDIMDNKFVPNKSLFFDFKIPKTSCLFEAHLMILDPEKWIKKNWKKVDTILVHYESCNNHNKIISEVKNKDKIRHRSRDPGCWCLCRCDRQSTQRGCAGRSWARPVGRPSSHASIGRNRLLPTNSNTPQFFYLADLFAEP